jgi:hypothetical protein
VELEVERGMVVFLNCRFNGICRFFDSGPEASLVFITAAVQGDGPVAGFRFPVYFTSFDTRFVTMGCKISNDLFTVNRMQPVRGPDDIFNNQRF